jgi:hypothetical protein
MIKKGAANNPTRVRTQKGKAQGRCWVQKQVQYLVQYFRL